MKNKKNIRVEIFLIIMPVIILFGIIFITNNKHSQIQKTNESVDAKLQEIREDSNKTEEIITRTICIYKIQKEMIYEDTINEIKNMSSSVAEEDNKIVLYTDYVSERNEIKDYIKNQIETTVEKLEHNNISISYDLKNSTVTISEMEGYTGNSILDKDVKNLCGLIGVYSIIENEDIEDDLNWCVLAYKYDTSGNVSIFEFSENMNSLEIQNTQTSTDAEYQDLQNIEIRLEGDKN